MGEVCAKREDGCLAVKGKRRNPKRALFEWKNAEPDTFWRVEGHWKLPLSRMLGGRAAFDIALNCRVIGL